MIISCERCAKRYGLADARVPPGGCRVPCPQCGSVIEVRPPRPPPLPERRAPGVEPPPAVPAPARQSPSAPTSTTATATAVAPARAMPTATASVGAKSKATAPVFATATPGAPPTPAAVTAAHRQPPGADPDLHAWSPTEERVLPRRGLGRGSRPALAIGIVAALGVTAAGAWLATGPDGSGGSSAPPRERPDGPDAGGTPARPAAAQPASPPTAGTTVDPAPPVASPARRAAPSIGPAPGRRPGSSLAGRDRKLLDLLDRKQDAPKVTAPAAGAPSTGRGALDEPTIRGALASNSGAFSACIAKAARADPAGRYQGKTLVLELVVRPSGRVARSRLENQRYAQTALGRCLAAAARRMVFPSFEGEELLVQAPLQLTAIQ